MISGIFFDASLRRALSTTSSLSAANPTQKGGEGRAATVARISALGANSSAGAFALESFLIFSVLGFATRQSATAATEMNTSAGKLAITASCISRAVVTSMRRTPRGLASDVGPATSVTSAPASRAACASANPVLPEERLVIPRTGSIGSKVGPAVSSTRLPASRFGWKNATISSSSSFASSMRPAPVSPQACAPLAGPSIVMPSARSWPTLRCVAGFSHISTFIAGATSSGVVERLRASASVDSRSSARPCATFARKCAVAGATISACAPRVRSMCGIALAVDRSHWSDATGRPESACIVVAVTNSRAAAVITTCTVAPWSCRRRTSSQTL